MRTFFTLFLAVFLLCSCGSSESKTDDVLAGSDEVSTDGKDPYAIPDGKDDTTKEDIGKEDVAAPPEEGPQPDLSAPSPSEPSAAHAPHHKKHAAQKKTKTVVKPCSVRARPDVHAKAIRKLKKGSTVTVAVHGKHWFKTRDGHFIEKSCLR